MKTLILPPDKTFNYQIPNLPAVYVRTGVIGDGSCFFHSYLRATDHRYRQLTTDSRKDSVQKLRNSIADSVTLDNFRAISNGEHRKMLFFGALRKLLEQEHNIPHVSSSCLVKVLETVTTFVDNFYLSFIEQVLTTIPQDCPTSDKQNIVECIKKIFTRANEISIEYFKTVLCTSEIGSTEIEFVSLYLKCNFLFLYETDKGIEQYPFSQVINDTWQFYVLLWVQESHYEIIGRKDSNHVITRIFYKEDELIQSFLYNKFPPSNQDVE